MTHETPAGLVDPTVEETRSRMQRGPSPRELATTAVMSGSLLATGLALALLVPSSRHPSLLLVLGLVAAYAALSRVEFEVGSGAAVATQLAFVPMLFLLPLGFVPLAVAGGYAASALVSRRPRVDDAAMLVGAAWFAVGPVLVLAIPGEQAPALDQAPIYVLAFAAQFAFDVGSSVVREWLAFGQRPSLPLRAVAWAYMVDAALAPLGLLGALAAETSPLALVALAPLVGLLAVFARERRMRIDHAIDLSTAYRGSALLLGDLVEADDSYTSEHSHGVVALALAVADELGLDAAQRRQAELAALLHDVGKIRIPKAILNKPGPLDPDELVIMRTHAEEGQKILDRIGGVLSDVGISVRHHHERWDGGGYPDGIAGEAIPLVSRIISVCDTFSAITTNRPYRAARTQEEAVAELRSCSGSQFDPTVVAALERALQQPAFTLGAATGSSLLEAA